MVAGPIMGCLVLYVLVTQSLAPFFVQGPRAGASEAAFKASLDRAVPQILSRYRIPGAAIATVVNGAPARVYAFGFADIEHHRRVTPQTVFQVASISKSVTAWGVMTLVDSGKIDLDQPAERYVASWPLASSRFPAKGVTPRLLLTHRSGLNAGEDEFRKPSDRAATPAELIAREGPPEQGRPGRARLVGRAGADFIYSVPGYMLLQMIIEHQSGRPFGGFMHDAVLQPLGMTTSSFDWDPRLRNETATPYLAGGRPSAVRVPQDQAADGLFSTAGDLARFIAAPLPDAQLPAGAGVLSPLAVRQLFLRPDPGSGRILANLTPEIPCLGCFLERSPGGAIMVSNGGYDPGWSSQIYTVPATGDGLVILTNTSGAEPAIAQIAGIWTDWRGIPRPLITRSYRTIGGYSVLAVGLMSFFAMAGAIAFLDGAVAKRRRFAAFHPLGVFQSLVEWGVAASLVSIWFLMRGAFEILPAFSLVAKIALAGLVMVVVARTLFPTATADKPAA